MIGLRFLAYDPIHHCRKRLVSAAGLNVVEREPIARDNPLLVMENVIINPHVAWHSKEVEVEMQIEVAMGVLEVLQGRYPRTL